MTCTGTAAMGKQYEIMINKSPQKTLDKLKNRDYNVAKIISNHIIKLEINPYTSRSGVDISPIVNSNPPEYRLRIGAQTRVTYMINDTEKVVTITRIKLSKRRKSDYKK